MKIISSFVSTNSNIKANFFLRIPILCIQALLYRFRNDLRLTPIFLKEKIGIAIRELIKQVNLNYQEDSFDRHIEYINSHKPIKDNANIEQEIVKIKQV